MLIYDHGKAFSVVRHQILGVGGREAAGAGHWAGLLWLPLQTFGPQETAGTPSKWWGALFSLPALPFGVRLQSPPPFLRLAWPGSVIVTVYVTVYGVHCPKRLIKKCRLHFSHTRKVFCIHRMLTLALTQVSLSLMSELRLGHSQGGGGERWVE